MAIGTPTLIGATVSVLSNAATSAITVGAAGVPAGATIVVMGFEGNQAVAFTVTDNKGNTYTLRASGGGGTTDFISLLVADNITALVNTDVITVHWHATANEGMCAAYSITGLATASFDTQKVAGSTAATLATSGDLTTAQANEIIIGIIGVQSAPTQPPYSLNNSFTQLDSVTPATGDAAQWGYRIYSSVQSSGDAIAHTFATNSDFIAGILALKDPGGGAAPGPGFFINSTVGQERPGPRPF